MNTNISHRISVRIVLVLCLLLLSATLACAAGILTAATMHLIGYGFLESDIAGLLAIKIVAAILAAADLLLVARFMRRRSPAAFPVVFSQQPALNVDACPQHATKPQLQAA